MFEFHIQEAEISYYPLNWSDGDFLAGAEGGVRLLSKLLLQGDS